MKPLLFGIFLCRLCNHFHPTPAPDLSCVPFVSNALGPKLQPPASLLVHSTYLRQTEIHQNLVLHFYQVHFENEFVISPVSCRDGDLEGKQ